MTKRNIVISILVGLVFVVLYWTYAKVDTVNKGVEQFESQQAKLDNDFKALNMKHCGKPTLCSDDDIMRWEFSKSLEKEDGTIQQEIDKKEEVANRSYQQIFSFEGNGAKNSEPFTVRGNRFKIKYDCTGDYCGAFLEQTNGRLFGNNVIMNSPGPISDETVFYETGEYYISANTMGDFTFIVEDYK